MLPKAHRLRGTAALLRVQRSRVVARTTRMTLRVVRRDNGGVPRVAIAVGRSVSRRAVDRNMVMRWMREALRRELPSMSSPVDLRLSATAPFSAYSYQRCTEDIRSVLRKAGLLALV